MNTIELNVSKKYFFIIIKENAEVLQDKRQENIYTKTVTKEKKIHLINIIKAFNLIPIFKKSLNSIY